MLTMVEFLRYVVDQGGSDIHLCSGRRPHIRVHGNLTETDFDVLKPVDVKNLIYNTIKPQQIEILERNMELDMSYMIPDVSRFRVNIYIQRGSLGMVARVIPFQVPPFEQLGIPPILKTFVEKLNGLVLVTGPQGSGKTTTLAAIVDYINATRRAHIVTIEDPIEYMHRSKKSIINQREVGTDTTSYTEAIRHVLRQDPDVCLIGEMRDAVSIKAALNLAESGILVLSSLHSPTAEKTISRIVDLFTPEYQQQVRVQLSLSLIGVISQQLIPRQDGKGRVLACEVMKKTNSIENMIRTYSIKDIHSAIQSGKEEGMYTMDQSLLELYVKNTISKYELYRRALDLRHIQQMLI